MIFHRTLKLISTLIKYGFYSVGAGFGAAFLAAFCLSIVPIDPEDQSIVLLGAGVGGSAIVGIAGLGKMKRYATCSITKETLAIEDYKINWITETNQTTQGNTQITEHWKVPYTYLVLEGINGGFSVRGGYQNYRYATMRFYIINTNTGSLIFDYDFLGVS